MSRIVDFYLGKARHPRGVTIDQVRGWSDFELEAEHTYIQWLFPLREPSLAVPGSPVLTAEEVERFRADPRLRQGLLESFARMLAFYGFTLRVPPGDPRAAVVEPGPDFARRSASWLTPRNHNFLRITRILKSLTLLGCGDAAKLFFAALQRVYSENQAVVGRTTLDYWRDAVGAG